MVIKFLYLENFYKEWRDILVIGKTIERDDRIYHIIGMTLDDEADWALQTSTVVNITCYIALGMEGIKE